MTPRKLGLTGASLLMACLGLLLLGPMTALAQVNPLANAQITVLIMVPPILRVETESNEIVFTAQEVRDGEQADGSFVVEKEQAIRLTTTANVPHSLWVSASSDVFIGENGTIPSNRLHWRWARGNWWPLSTELQLVRESMIPSRNLLDMDLRLVLEITDPPGSYDGEILFTLQHPGA